MFGRTVPLKEEGLTFEEVSKGLIGKRQTNTQESDFTFSS